MFASATLKLTAWYLAILMVISLVFSVAIYQVASSEVNARLEGLQLMLERDTHGYVLPPDQAFFELRATAAAKAAANLFVSLFYVNLAVLLAGGAGAFWLANRTLRPIEHAHDAQARFVSDASHELRTPLAVMQTELEVALREKSLSKTATKEILTSTLEEVVKLSRLSSTLLQLSRIEQPTVEKLEKSRFDLTTIVRNVIERYDPAGKRLIIDAPSSALIILANLVTIEELVTILVDNALKYSPPNSKITLTLSRQQGNAVLVITNPGAGISPDVLPHIFERFYRVDTSRTKSGSGLGLALAKKIVELHDGSLTAESGNNLPTTFTASFALAPKKP